MKAVAVYTKLVDNNVKAVAVYRDVNTYVHNMETKMHIYTTILFHFSPVNESATNTK